jgi:hypothetical protein
MASWNVKIGIVLAAGALALASAQADAQEFGAGSSLDSNTYYRFPVSIGAEFESLTPLGAFGTGFSVLGASSFLRIPIPSIPWIQPLVQGGVYFFNSSDSSGRFSHQHYYGMIGLGLSNRFSKSFEVGGEILGGVSEAVYPQILPDEGPQGSPTILARAGLELVINPSFNLSLNVHPGIVWFQSLTPFTDYDGAAFSIGFSATYRFGEDPDAPQAAIRSITFDTPAIAPVFAAMQSYYVQHPIGTVTITNIESYAIADIEVYFNQPGYMDSPTLAAKIPSLKPGEARVVPLLASYNAEVFLTAGVTPLNGEVRVKYRSRGRAAEQTQPVMYDLQDKSALVWDDDRKVAAFITPQDGGLVNYVSFVRRACEPESVPAVNMQTSTAMEVFEGLSEIHLLYQPDPVTPFAAFHGSTTSVDSVSLPRDTLKRGTGDCDDLTVAYCSLLEAAGVETGFITIPGHIYAAFNTGVSGRSASSLNPDSSMTLNVDGQLWIPVEITLIGKDSFMGAWRKGAAEYHAFDTKPEARRLYRTRQAQETFRAIGLKDADLGLQYGSDAKILERYRLDLAAFGDTLIKAKKDAAERNMRKEDYNNLGVEYVKLRRYALAADAFTHALSVDPSYVNAMANMGSLKLVQEDTKGALSLYLAAAEILQKPEHDDPLVLAKVSLAIAKAYYKLEQTDKAKEYYDLAKSADPSTVAEYAYLGSTQETGARASAAAGPLDVPYFMEEGGEAQ